MTSKKSFRMLSTAQNRCGVFSGIGAILTGRHKTAILCRRLYEGLLILRFSGGVCLHVIQCIILLITHKITRYPCIFVHTADHILRG